LTDKICRESGICNVKTQLLSSSSLRQPGVLRVDGVAILAFGQASLMPALLPQRLLLVRRLRAVPIRGLSPATTSKPLWLPSRETLSANDQRRVGGLRGFWLLTEGADATGRSESVRFGLGSPSGHQWWFRRSGWQWEALRR
jgi:hypothetical protein